MIIHCSKKLAAKLPTVSASLVKETSPLGSWHAHLYHMDKRQCVMFCHDETRYILFLAGLKKPQFAELGRWHRDLFLAVLQMQGVAESRLKQIELMLGPTLFDTVTDRSVQGTMRVAKEDFEMLERGSD